MTFNQIWNSLVRKQPRLERDDAIVEFTAGNLRRLLKQVYEQGKASAPCEPKENPFADFLGF